MPDSPVKRSLLPLFVVSFLAFRLAIMNRIPQCCLPFDRKYRPRLFDAKLTCYLRHQRGGSATPLPLSLSLTRNSSIRRRRSGMSRDLHGHPLVFVRSALIVCLAMQACRVLGVLQISIYVSIVIDSCLALASLAEVLRSNLLRSRGSTNLLAPLARS